MPRVKWDDIPEPDDFSPIPDGEYLMQVTECEEREAKTGPMFSMRLDVQRGPFKGRRVFDNITFSPEGLKRVKLVLSRLGCEFSGEVDIEPKDVIGKSAWVTVTQGSYWSEKRQREVQKNEVPFGGYRRAEGGDATRSDAEVEAEPVPF